MITSAFSVFVLVAIFSSGQSRYYGNQTPKPPKTIPGYMCEVNTTEHKLNMKLYYHRGKRICTEVSEDKLLRRLQKIGGWNPLYTAVTKEQASKFPDPRLFLGKGSSTTQAPNRICTTAPTYKPTTPWHYYKPRPTPRPWKPWHPKKPRPRPRPWKPWYPKKPRPRPRPWKPWHPKMPRPRPRPWKPWHPKRPRPRPRPRKSWRYRKSRKGRGRRGRYRPWKPRHRGRGKRENTEVFQSDEQMNEYGIMNDEDILRAPQREENVLVAKRVTRETKDCWGRGDAVRNSNDQRYYLCGECHVVTTLDDGNDNVRPRAINEATCKHGLPSSDSQKDSTNQCARNSGFCNQRILRFPALRHNGQYEIDQALTNQNNGQPIYVKKYDEYTQNINAGCQCEMFKAQFNLLGLAGRR